MNLADLNPRQIFTQSEDSDKNYHWPEGWEMTLNEEGSKEIDVVKGL